MKPLFQKVLTVMSATLVFLSTASPALAQTSSWSGVCIHEKTLQSGEVIQVATVQGLQCLLANVLSTFLSLVGIAAFVILVVSAFRIMAAGSSNEVENSKKAITQAVIGLFVAVSAFIILNLVAEFTGVKTILNFVIPDSSTQW